MAEASISLNTNGNASLTNASVVSIRCRRHVVLEINHDSKQASLQECHCPSCLEQQSSRGDDDDDSDKFENDDCSDCELYSMEGVSEEEDYEATNKVSKKSGWRRTRPKHLINAARRKASKHLKPREAHKRELRQQEKAEERAQRRKPNEAGKSCKADGQQEDSEDREEAAPEESRPSTEYDEDAHMEYFDSTNVLTAEELGVEDEDMYERLMEIAMDGDDITPEDFELLLQLDSKNNKATMNSSDINQYELLVIGEGRGQVRPEGLQSDCCLVCLESFSGLEVGTELRRLPCQHVFCKSCIDQWLKENSVKCPSLSCFWAPGEDQSSGGRKRENHVESEGTKEDTKTDVSDKCQCVTS